jgi:hypothetical protein
MGVYTDVDTNAVICNIHNRIHKMYILVLDICNRNYIRVVIAVIIHYLHVRYWAYFSFLGLLYVSCWFIFIGYILVDKNASITGTSISGTTITGTS